VTLVVGYAPDGRARAVLDLASMLARSSGEELVISAVVPVPWPPSPARVDAEYREYLDRLAADALEHARARIPEDVSASVLVHHARSAPAGLLEVAEEHDATAIVAGSSPEGGAGHVSLGSVTARLLHTSSAPVALAPRGFRARPGARVERITAAFGGTRDADDLVIAAAAVAARIGASLRLASFAVRSRPPYTSGVGSDPERALIAQWTEEIREAAEAALASLRELPDAPADIEVVVGHGESWYEALDDVEWGDGDVLVVGSSSAGPIARVFLGSRANKIVRHSPVPVVVVPRSRVHEIAGEAVAAAPG
jgi:nucleotide-binding universal stress UspA family protein